MICATPLHPSARARPWACLLSESCTGTPRPRQPLDMPIWILIPFDAPVSSSPAGLLRPSMGPRNDAFDMLDCGSCHRSRMFPRDFLERLCGVMAGHGVACASVWSARSRPHGLCGCLRIEPHGLWARPRSAASGPPFLDWRCGLVHRVRAGIGEWQRPGRDDAGLEARSRWRCACVLHCARW